MDMHELAAIFYAHEIRLLDEAVKQAYERLEPKLQQALDLHYGQHKSWGEIAQIMRLSLANPVRAGRRATKLVAQACALLRKYCAESVFYPLKPEP
jgi:DNA-directed RNA polymerase specialized sigma24 family protein